MGRSFALIIGGTSGLGRGIAIRCLQRGITPVVTGRSASRVMDDPALKGALFVTLDLTDAATLARERRIYELFREGGFPLLFTHVFWVAGAFQHLPLVDCTAEDIGRMAAIHLTGPLEVLRAVHWTQSVADGDHGMAYHLVTVGSTSSWKLREDEALYCALKAAKAHFTRNFAVELFRDLPGSKVTLVHPGGIRTPGFWHETGRDISAYMDPGELADVIWDIVADQRTPYEEWQIPRSEDGTPMPRRGAVEPQTP